MADFIPSNDDAFNHFIALLATGVDDESNPLKLPTALAAAFSSTQADWNTAWSAWDALAPRIKSALETKDAARVAVEAQARTVNASAQANPAVTDTVRALYDLPVHKTSHTAAPVPATAPMMIAVDTQHLLQRLHWVDSATPGSKAKPAGVQVCEIRQTILATGAPAPTGPAAMAYLASDSRAPHRTDFDAGDMGKTAWYALRWVNTRQEPGPWSAITGYLIA